MRSASPPLGSPPASSGEIVRKISSSRPGASSCAREVGPALAQQARTAKRAVSSASAAGRSSWRSRRADVVDLRAELAAGSPPRPSAAPRPCLGLRAAGGCPRRASAGPRRCRRVGSGEQAAALALLAQRLVAEASARSARCAPCRRRPARRRTVARSAWNSCAVGGAAERPRAAGQRRPAVGRRDHVEQHARARRRLGRALPEPEPLGQLDRRERLRPRLERVAGRFDAARRVCGAPRTIAHPSRAAAPTAFGRWPASVARRQHLVNTLVRDMLRSCGMAGQTVRRK